MIEECRQTLWTSNWSDIIWAYSVCPSGFENISADDKTRDSYCSWAAKSQILA